MSTSSILTLCKPLVTGVSTLLQRLKLEVLTAFIHDVINNNQAAFVPLEESINSFQSSLQFLLEKGC